ncbi:MAG: tRNA pseudouridine(55) synthase TruB [Pseudomonadota bacterium]
MHGILPVDKPEGLTSAQVVRIVKRVVKPAKVGHTGTLDPAASGLLVVSVGAATRSADYLLESPKVYDMVILLGEETDTLDGEGQVVRRADIGHITLDDIREALSDFGGVIQQVPPDYSALKKDGVPLYKMARRGIPVAPQPRWVEIFGLDLKEWVPPILRVAMSCSKGTYARSMARDIGNRLGACARLDGLRRTRSGVFSVEGAVSPDEIMSGGPATIAANLIDLPTALSHIPSIDLSPAEARRLLQGSHAVIERRRSVALDGPGEQRPELLKVVENNGGVVILVQPVTIDDHILLKSVRAFKAFDD